MPLAAPAASGLDCAGACVPADGVGGDYYDFLPLGGGRLGIALGDVSGKGMYAGLLAAALQARLQAITARGPQSPAGTLTELNRLTVGTIDANRFATVFLCAFDRATFSLTYANAGHPPAVILSPDDAVCTLESTGPAIGWSGDVGFDEASVAFAADDLFAVFSDGISEASAPDGTELGVNGVVDMVRRHASLPAAGIVEAVCREVDRFTAGAPAADDRTLVVARIVSAAEPVSIGHAPRGAA